VSPNPFLRRRGPLQRATPTRRSGIGFVFPNQPTPDIRRHLATRGDISRHPHVGERWVNPTPVGSSNPAREKPCAAYLPPANSMAGHGLCGRRQVRKGTPRYAGRASYVQFTCQRAPPPVERPKPARTSRGLLQVVRSAVTICSRKIGRFPGGTGNLPVVPVRRHWPQANQQERSDVCVQISLRSC
jgi:hypothetical protein